ncbi:hypothetical protein CICLE_v100249421mg, partial [Citrus x clementina]
MSKTILSRIKPLQNQKPSSSSSSPFPLAPHIKKLVNETIEILKTHPQYDQSLEIRFSDEETYVSEIAHHVLDRIRDLELGLKFFDWLSRQQPKNSFSNGYACSSFLKLLARFRVFSEIELVLKNLKIDGIKPTHEALSVIIRAYAESGLVDKAIDLYTNLFVPYNSVPDVFTCNSLLNLLVKCKRIEMARKLYDEMCKTDDGLDNYSTCIMVRGLCKEGKVEEGKNLIEDRFGKGCIPNIVFYNTLIDGYCKKGDVENARKLFKELKMKGFLPTLETYGAII